jgi:p-cumate 2,3-dioxygenase beta subunit
MPSPTLREEVEIFLYAEATLLDRWQLREWRALFTSDGQYLIVTPGIDDPENASPKDVLFLVADDQERLAQRVERLLDRTAHVEYPHSRTRHFVSNVVCRGAAAGEIEVEANFLVFRTKSDETTYFPGHVRYRLTHEGDALRIREKRCVIDTDSLAMQGKVSIIL